MASKRKSTTPCMIPLKALALEGGSDVADEFKDQNSTEGHQEEPPAADLIDNHELLTNGHENVEGFSFFCKYCNFGSQETGPLVEHMNTKHLDFRDDPSYVCIACSFLVKDPKELEAHNSDCHPGDSGLSWTVARHESYTVVEQSVGGHSLDPDEPACRTDDRMDDYSEMAMTKTSIMRNFQNKRENKKIITIKDSTNHIGEEPERKGRPMTRNSSVITSKLANNISHLVNGSIIGTVPMLQTGVTQLLSLNTPQSMIQPKLSTTIITPVLPKPSMQRTQSQQLPTAKLLPKVMIPLSSIPTYNSAMDSNCFLKNSFHKFPYPSKAELCYLTVVTKYPEEQIKIWFTAQRLKQGISWSPEEIEDSRKKMFNTIIQSIPQPVPQPTITVLNAPLVTSANNVQHLIQATLPGQIVSQPQGTGGVIVTRPIITNGIQGTPTCVSLAVAPISTSQTTQAVTESYSTTADRSSPNSSPSSFFDISSRSKKSRQQLGALKNSFCKSQFPSHGEVARLTRITGLATREVRKWFSDKRYHFRNKPQTCFSDPTELLADPQSDAIFAMGEHDADVVLQTSSQTPSHTPSHSAPHTPSHTPSHTPRRQSWHQTPDFTTTRYKERAPEQLRALESSFAKNASPSDEEVTRLRSETKMTRREIDGWFSEKRKRVAEELKREKVRYEDEENSTEETENFEPKTSNEVEPHPVENNSPVTERKVNPIKINLKALRVTDAGDHTNALRDDNGVHSDAGSRSSTPQKTRATKKTAQQRDFLKQLFVKTQWPTSDEYDSLVEQTGLPRPEIVRWFGDCRYNYKHGTLRWYTNYKRNYGLPKPVSQPITDCYSEQQTLYEGGDKNLREKPQISPEKVEADKTGAADDSIMDSSVDHGDRSESQNTTHDGFSEASENCESWESKVHDHNSASTSQQQPSVIQLGAD
ncbi:zinc fingers and homeoboxes protein 3 [Hyperolius riggenbachi]|uniref:zinc fingers and homeoboxes protein 3 n=1 Tax=Hyperolius riggenbachi TaxID=752182 RepID=UPI0035A289A0